MITKDRIILLLFRDDRTSTDQGRVPFWQRYGQEVRVVIDLAGRPRLKEKNFDVAVKVGHVVGAQSDGDVEEDGEDGLWLV